MMLAAIAQAICEANGDDWYREGPGGLMQTYEPLARAAVTAFRDIGDAQIEAASDEIHARKECGLGIFASDIIETVCNSIFSEAA